MYNQFGKIAGLSPSQTHGPIVKTGPTAGKNRSRNKNGRWRAKRSDAGTSKNITGGNTMLGLVEVAGLTMLGSKITAGTVLANVGSIITDIGPIINIGNQIAQAIKQNKERKK